jgi:hypothetical protein
MDIRLSGCGFESVPGRIRLRKFQDMFPEGEEIALDIATMCKT